MVFSSFANIAKSLTKLTEQKQSFQWTPEEEALSKLSKVFCVLLRFLPTSNQDRGSS
jgi:hypothetical protein